MSNNILRQLKEKKNNSLVNTKRLNNNKNIRMNNKSKKSKKLI